MDIDMKTIECINSVVCLTSHRQHPMRDVVDVIDATDCLLLMSHAGHLRFSNDHSLSRAQGELSSPPNDRWGPRGVKAEKQ